MPYSVQTPVFEGPFDLLLHLILRKQVDVYEVSLAAIVDEFVGELERLQHCDLEVATEFLLIAATLVELKTRWLLPAPDDLDLDEELALWEERDLLLARLVECKTFKDAAGVLRSLLDEGAKVVARRVGPDECYVALAPDLLEDVTPADVRDAFVRATAPKRVPRVSLDHVTIVRASVADAIAEIADEVRRAGEMTFRELTVGLGERIEIVVRFLAVLELYKQGLVDLDQVSSFGRLEVRWTGGADDSAELVAIDSYDG